MCSHTPHSLNFVLVKIMTTASKTTAKKTKAELKAEAEALAKQQAEAEASQAPEGAEKPAETTVDAPESTEGEDKTEQSGAETADSQAPVVGDEPALAEGAGDTTEKSTLKEGDQPVSDAPVDTESTADTQAPAGAEKPAETTADAPESTVVDQAEVVALGPLQLRVTNFGQKTMCQVTNRTIPKDGTVVIDYANPRQKQLAMGNFAQINKFNRDRKRFKVEG